MPEEPERMGTLHRKGRPDRVVHKFVVPINSAWNGVLLPRGTNLVHVGNTILDMNLAYVSGSTGRYLHFWAEVPANATPEDHIYQQFRVYGTGEPITDPAATWVGTFIEDGFVWHLYMKPDETG